MAQLVDIKKVEVGPSTLEATVRVMPGAPLMTSEDIEATALVYNVMPHIAEHACTGDAGPEFKDAMGNTEIAHLLEHVAVELMARAGADGQIVCGRTRGVSDDPRSFVIQLACPDDVLAIGALSSAAWIVEWAFTGGDGPVPDVDAIAAGIARLAAEAPVANDEPEAASVPTPVEDEPQQGDAEEAFESSDVPEDEASQDEALVDKSQEDDDPIEVASADDEPAGDIDDEGSASEEGSNG